MEQTQIEAEREADEFFATVPVKTKKLLPIETLDDEMIGPDPDFQKTVDERFWELI